MSSNNTADNKWAKNCFGNVVPPDSTSKGKFSSEESILIREAVEEYCAARKISAARLCSECHHRADLKGAWLEISKCVPHRSVQSVYRHGLRILHPFRRGPWSDQEEIELYELVQRLGKKWVTIQNKLNRSADSCRDKYREMGEGLVKGRWKEEETKALRKLIREHLHASPKATMKELGEMAREKGLALPWLEISKKMGKRSRLSCFKKWQKMTGLISPSEMEAEKSGGTKKKTARQSRKSSSSRSAIAKSKRNDPPGKKTTDTDTAKKTGASVQHDDEEEDEEEEEHMESPHEDDDDVGGEEDLDSELLAELVQLGAAKASDVPWNSIIRGIDDAQDRWNNLLMEWQEREGVEATEDAMTDLPLSGLAQLLLDSKRSAKVAAETVIEAVDLPDVA